MSGGVEILDYFERWAGNKEILQEIMYKESVMAYFKVLGQLEAKGSEETNKQIRSPRFKRGPSEYIATQ
jgi:hypothetical protein